MQVGDLVRCKSRYKMGKYAVIIKIIKTEPLLYKIFMEDGQAGYAYRPDMTLIKNAKPVKN